MNGADCASVRPLARPTAAANILNMPWKSTRSRMPFESLSQPTPYIRLPPKATAVVRRNELACRARNGLPEAKLSRPVRGTLVGCAHNAFNADYQRPRQLMEGQPAKRV